MSETVETPVVETPAVVEPAKETDWKAEARKWEDRAKENLAKATANESAAQRLAEIEEANKTETQKAQDALARAQEELATANTARLRAEVAADKGIPAALLSGSTQEELEASADALIAFRGEQKQTPSSSAIGRTNVTPEEPSFDAAIKTALDARDFALVATLRSQQAEQQARLKSKE